MVRCTGFGLIVSPDRHNEVVEWPFAVQGINSTRFERIENLEYSSVIRGEENCVKTAYMIEEDIAIWMIGEVYNRESIWNTIIGEEKNSSDLDVDLLLNLIRLYGTTALRLVNGRFAAVIRFRDRLLLVTDHAGTIPLYFHISKNSIYVATEAKALILGGNLSPGLRKFEDRIFEQNMIETIFKGINRVPIGSIIEINLRTFEMKKEHHWRMPSERLVISEEKACHLLYETLDKAVEFQKGENDSVGVILSGGIDSSAITSLIAPKVTKLYTFSIGTESANEFEYAKFVADRYQTDHHEFLIREEEFLEKLPHVVWAAEVPHAEFIEYLTPVYITYQHARSFTNRILTGYGSDILFGGMLDPHMSIEELDNYIQQDVLSIDGSNEFTHTIGLVHGIWTTHPYWDREFLRITLQLDPRLKNLHGIEKYILRKSFESFLPQRNVWRKKIGVHQSTGTENAFTKWVNENIRGNEPLAVRKNKIIYNLLQTLYVEGANPDEININNFTK
ncbi:asparagine synthase-related protein [Anoxybacteroides rupiense]|uniref:asparagine synthase-related protein n=1 Tax=Anoxybacteroides rupiense TaxID=311460 RepID=UPI001605BEBE|nr:asparagine synthase C-terminal domain-containing protein [Anoxybacillus rupiensis]MBB3907506.1 (carboxyethyl)arginine beta-lactam-synthase [Anoxybacillus rupiensis]